MHFTSKHFQANNKISFIKTLGRQLKFKEKRYPKTKDKKKHSHNNHEQSVLNRFKVLIFDFFDVFLREFHNLFHTSQCDYKQWERKNALESSTCSGVYWITNRFYSRDVCQYELLKKLPRFKTWKKIYKAVHFDFINFYDKSRSIHCEYILSGRIVTRHSRLIRQPFNKD